MCKASHCGSKQQWRSAKLVIGNWNITSHAGKEHELIEEAKRYSPDVVGISTSTKCRDSNTVDMCRDRVYGGTGGHVPPTFGQGDIIYFVPPQHFVMKSNVVVQI